VRAKRAAKGWQGIQLLEVLQGWWGYLQYGLPCVLMVCLEVRQQWDSGVHSCVCSHRTRDLLSGIAYNY
jgi:hypothetical protein